MEKPFVTINAVREVYDPADIYHTLTVGELKRILEDFSDDVKIIISHDNGYTFGALTQERISEEWLEIDD